MAPPVSLQMRDDYDDPSKVMSLDDRHGATRHLASNVR